jgi:hypothetical protein
MSYPNALGDGLTLYYGNNLFYLKALKMQLRYTLHFLGTPLLRIQLYHQSTVHFFKVKMWVALILVPPQLFQVRIKHLPLL